jgi:hypothetical protein
VGDVLHDPHSGVSGRRAVLTAASEVMLGSFVFSSVSPVQEPEPRWQRGLANRLKQTGAVRSATAK